MSIRTTQISGMQSRQVLQMMKCRLKINLTKTSLPMKLDTSKIILMNLTKVIQCLYCKTMTLIMTVVVMPMRKLLTIC